MLRGTKVSCALSDRFLSLLTYTDRHINKHKTCCPFNPTVTCTFRDAGISAALVVKLAWSGHLPLTVSRDRFFAVEDLEEGLQKLYREQGHFVCPQLRPGPVTGAGLCDSPATTVSSIRGVRKRGSRARRLSGERGRLAGSTGNLGLGVVA